MTANPPNQQERRANSHEFKVTAENPGIIRVQKIAVDALQRHDDQWKDADQSVWQVNYSLRNHCQKVQAVTHALAEHQELGDYAEGISLTAGLSHDVGKLDESCRLYRLNRKLTTKEKATVDKHAALSGVEILKAMDRVRPQDLELFTDVYHVVRFHHRPEMIEDPLLRQIGFNLNGADRFISLQEDRGDRLGRSQVKALEKTEADMRELMLDPIYDPFIEEMERTINSLNFLYGLES